MKQAFLHSHHIILCLKLFLIWSGIRNLPFPLNNTWGYHDAATGNGRWDLYYKEMVKRYGEPVSMEDFCNKMQLMNAIGYQGIFEAAGHKLNDIGGVMLWKLNAAFPSVVWQVYDWYPSDRMQVIILCRMHVNRSYSVKS